MDNYLSTSKKLLATPAIAALLLLTFATSPFSQQRQGFTHVGKFSYKGAPEDLDSKTVRVDSNMVAMAERIYVSSTSSTSTSLADTPSVFFVIDNSSSMRNQNDPNGYRFSAALAFIDTLKKKFPNVEVGVSVFSGELWFLPAANAPYVPCPGQHGDYFPLLQLDRLYPAYRNSSGYDLITSALATRGGSLIYSGNTTAGTNITAGFDAAKNAFSSSTSMNVNRKDRQFIIFFSDGEANQPRNNNAEILRFEKGDSVPTTFTIYFTDSTTVPSTIATMTANIQKNYPNSANWPYKVKTSDSLMSFLMTKVFTVISNSNSVTPKQITVGTTTASNWTVGAFAFTSLFPLTGLNTPFSFAITYSDSNNHVFVKNEVHQVDFNAQIDPARTLPADSFEVKSWDRDFSFWCNGAAISAVTEVMNPIEIRFTSNPGSANYNYGSVAIDLSNAKGTVRDHETLPLTKGAAYFSATFNRATTATPVQGNHVLEHNATGDSIIAVFRNSETTRLPLDTLRIAIPLNISPMITLDSAITRDLNGNGYIDRIDIFFSKDSALNTTAHDFSVTSNGVTFQVDSVVKLSGGSYSLILHEPVTLGAPPQSAWRPLITVTDLPGVYNGSVTAADGCPPVVWRVIDYAVNDKNIPDTVKVIMSEKITSAGGGAFTIFNQPAQTFYVWDSTQTLRLDTMLSGITTFYAIGAGDSTLIFIMANGHDLTGSNWINLNAGPMLLRDRNGNFPSSQNQKVRVEVMNGAVVDARPVPNPSGPTTKHVPDGTISFLHNPSAIGWVKQDHGGTVISLRNLPVPADPVERGKVTGYLKIYDVIGNVVNWATSTENGQPNLFDISGPSSQTVTQVDLYWNGLNKRGMKVAPGVYRAVVYVDYHGVANTKNLRLTAKVGIVR